MAKNKIKLTINVDNLDEAIEKANQLKRLLKEVQQNQFVPYDFFIEQTKASRETLRLRTGGLLIVCGLSFLMSLGAVITILLQNFH